MNINTNGGINLDENELPMADIDMNVFLDDYLATSRDMSTVDVFPLTCGLGKSSYIRRAIAQAIDNGDGLIVVTDRIEGLQDYTHTDREDEKELNDYLLEHKEQIALLYNETIMDEIPYLYGGNGKKAKPIILMTMQRYFSLSVEEITKLTSTYKQRKTIIFDEKPRFTEWRKIGIDELNKIDTAINSIDDTATANDKLWLLEQWQIVTKRIRSMFSEYERKNTKEEKTFWQDGIGCMSNDDERFFALIERYKKKFGFHQASICKKMLAVKQMFCEGATFTSNKKLTSKAKDREYSNFFTVLLDNSDKFLDVGAKTFVFDGTADISPDYDLYYINMIDCQQYKRKIPNATFRLFDFPTGKTRLTNRNHRHDVDAIMNFIGKHCIEPIIFTYLYLENKFKKAFPIVNHFGNIKGSNAYRKKTEIVQVGVNRFTDLAYKELTYFNRLTTREPNKKIVKMIGQNAVDQTMNRAILEDIEQNFFRSAIRDINCTSPVTYTIFLPIYAVDKKGHYIKDENGCKVYSDLVTMIKTRYEEYGAKVEIYDTPIELKLDKIINRKSNNQTYPQKIIDWLCTHDDCEFDIKDMLNDIGLEDKQFENVKNKNNTIMQLFKQMRIGKGRYKVDLKTLQFPV